MRAKGLEPPHLAALAPKADVSTNSTTPAAAAHTSSRIRLDQLSDMSAHANRRSRVTGVTGTSGSPKTWLEVRFLGPPLPREHIRHIRAPRPLGPSDALSGHSV